MAYDEDLTSRLRVALKDVAAVSEKRMMGGTCFMVHGNMIGGADRSKSGERRFMFRVGKDSEAEALARDGASVMVNGGRRMGGFIFVDEAHCDDAALGNWVALALRYIATLPPK